jgi:hypothetical protein
MTVTERKQKLAEKIDEFHRLKPRVGTKGLNGTPSWVKEGNFEVSYQKWTCETRYLVVLKEAGK